MEQAASLSRIVPLAVLVSLVACDTTPTEFTGDAPPGIALGVVAPELPPPADFVAQVDNAYFPLVPGTVFEYETDGEDGLETNSVEVTGDTKTILGITATVVHDQVFLEGELTEDTFDWYAQDRWGNVWYLGEDSCEFEEGECVSTEGSWEAGVDGAEAGIIMWANPAAHKGKTYRQEFYEDVAEDQGKVLRLNARVSVPYGDFEDCLETMDFTPLEPGVREHKFYCPGTGFVLEVEPRGGRVRGELVDITMP